MNGLNRSPAPSGLRTCELVTAPGGKTPLLCGLTWFGSGSFKDPGAEAKTTAERFGADVLGWVRWSTRAQIAVAAAPPDLDQKELRRSRLGAAIAVIAVGSAYNVDSFCAVLPLPGRQPGEAYWIIEVLQGQVRAEGDAIVGLDEAMAYLRARRSEVNWPIVFLEGDLFREHLADMPEDGLRSVDKFWACLTPAAAKGLRTPIRFGASQEARSWRPAHLVLAGSLAGTLALYLAWPSPPPAPPPLDTAVAAPVLAAPDRYWEAYPAVTASIGQCLEWLDQLPAFLDGGRRVSADCSWNQKGPVVSSVYEGGVDPSILHGLASRRGLKDVSTTPDGKIRVVKDVEITALPARGGTGTAPLAAEAFMPQQVRDLTPNGSIRRQELIFDWERMPGDGLPEPLEQLAMLGGGVATRVSADGLFKFRVTLENNYE